MWHHVAQSFQKDSAELDEWAKNVECILQVSSHAAAEKCLLFSILFWLIFQQIVHFTWQSAAQPRPRIRSRILVAMCFCERWFGDVWRVLEHFSLDGNCMSPHLQDASRIIKVLCMVELRDVERLSAVLRLVFALGFCLRCFLCIPVLWWFLYQPDSGCRSVTRVSGMAGLRSTSSSASGSTLKGKVKT